MFEIKVYCEKTELMIKLLINIALYVDDTPKVLHKFFTDYKSDYCHKIFEEINEADLPKWFNGKAIVRFESLKDKQYSSEIFSWVIQDVKDNRKLLGDSVYEANHGFIDFRYLSLERKLENIRNNVPVNNKGFSTFAVSRLMHQIISKFKPHIDDLFLVQNIIRK